MRYVFNSPLEWQEELPKFAMVWMTFLGAVFVYRRREHIVLDMLPKALPPRLASLLQLLITAVLATVLLVFLNYGLVAAESAKGQRIILLESLSLFWVYLAVPLGSGLLFLAVLQDSLVFAVQVLDPSFGRTSVDT
jgi:TRAP-type C4-dicarboxylate transport system permease small subunit